MKTVVVLSSVLVLAGCVTQPQEMGTMKLCERYLYGSGNRAELEAEVSRRGVDCNAHAETILRTKEAKQREIDQTLRTLATNPLFQQPPPVQFIQPLQQTCDTQFIGGMYRTRCY